MLRPDHCNGPARVQDEFLEEYHLQISACETFAFKDEVSASAEDPFDDDFQSVSHLLCQLNSASVVTNLWRNSSTEYDAVAYLRPDVLYNCDFPVEELDALDDNTAVIADFAHMRGGLNDRFLLASPRVAEIWGDRCASHCLSLGARMCPKFCLTGPHSVGCQLGSDIHASAESCLCCQLSGSS